MNGKKISPTKKFLTSSYLEGVNTDWLKLKNLKIPIFLPNLVELDDQTNVFFKMQPVRTSVITFVGRHMRLCLESRCKSMRNLLHVERDEDLSTATRTNRERISSRPACSPPKINRELFSGLIKIEFDRGTICLDVFSLL